VFAGKELRPDTVSSTSFNEELEKQNARYFARTGLVPLRVLGICVEKNNLRVETGKPSVLASNFRNWFA
jgi:hypothetical protein